MPRKPGEGKKVIAGLGANEYVAPTDEQWADLKLKSPLSRELRDQLVGITMIYALAGPGPSRHTLTAVEAARKIDKWQRATRVLRNQIWRSESKPSSVRKPTRVSVIRLFRDWRRINAYPWHSLAFLALALDAALAASEVITREIKDPNYPGNRQHELWSIWIALLIAVLRENKIAVTRKTASGKSRLDRNFVSIVEFLQSTLPPGYHHRRRAGDSLRAGIRNVLKLGVPRSEVPATIMLAWSALGWVGFEGGFSTKKLMLEVRSYIEKFTRQRS